MRGAGIGEADGQAIGEQQREGIELHGEFGNAQLAVHQREGGGAVEVDAPARRRLAEIRLEVGIGERDPVGQGGDGAAWPFAEGGRRVLAGERALAPAADLAEHAVPVGPVLVGQGQAGCAHRADPVQRFAADPGERTPAQRFARDHRPPPCRDGFGNEQIRSAAVGEPPSAGGAVAGAASAPAQAAAAAAHSTHCHSTHCALHRHACLHAMAGRMVGPVCASCAHAPWSAGCSAARPAGVALHRPRTDADAGRSRFAAVLAAAYGLAAAGVAAGLAWTTVTGSASAAGSGSSRHAAARTHWPRSRAPAHGTSTKVAVTAPARTWSATSSVTAAIWLAQPSSQTRLSALREVLARRATGA